MRVIGRIDREKYRAVSQDIRTDEVIMTDERIAHVQARHPGDFERYAQYLKEIVEDPDYIIADSRQNTAMVLKQIDAPDMRFRLALRLAVPSDEPGYRNSVLTFLKIREKEWNRLIKNRKVLYKSE